MRIAIHSLSLMIEICWLISGTNGQTFNPSPENTYVKMGENATFLCSIENADENMEGVQWSYVTEDENLDGLTLDDTVFADANKYAVTGTYNLIVISSSESDYGTYQCGLFTDSDIVFRAELIVLEGDPECSSNISAVSNENILIEGEYVQYDCEIRYSGIWAPQMTWIENGSGEYIPSTDEGVTDSIVREVIYIRATPETNGFTVQCDTNFGELDPPPGVNEASNIPDYTYIKTFPAITVHYPPKNTTITPVMESIHVGETLTCESSANPEVDAWEWIVSAHGEEVYSTSQSITIEEAWLDEVLNFSCTAFNTMRDERSGTDTVTIEDVLVFQTTTSTTTTTTTTTTTPEPTTAGGGGDDAVINDKSKGDGEDDSVDVAIIVGVLIPVLIIVIVVIVIVFFCCKRKANTKNKDAEASRPAKSTMQSDFVRKPYENNYSPNSAPVSTISGQPPPPYNGDTSYDSGYDPYGTDPRKRNVENIVYADLALDDTPRSRKPIQVYEQTDYAELQRV